MWCAKTAQVFFFALMSLMCLWAIAAVYISVVCPGDASAVKVTGYYIYLNPIMLVALSISILFIVVIICYMLLIKGGCLFVTDYQAANAVR